MYKGGIVKKDKTLMELVCTFTSRNVLFSFSNMKLCHVLLIEESLGSRSGFEAFITRCCVFVNILICVGLFCISANLEFIRILCFLVGVMLIIF